MANVCALPVRYKAGASEDRFLVEAAQALADTLERSEEYQTFVRLAQAINEDGQVSEMLMQVRARHESYHNAETSDLVAQLEGLEVMRRYRASEEALRQLCGEIDQLVGKQTGISFSGHVRPMAHG
jgi:cell fate (sporulation/competence/biofilm development) regulator YlbF (YheA/YmcA/DUF963 family)